MKTGRYWLCYDQQNVVGPYLVSWLKRWLALGIISETTAACAADEQTWITVKDIPGIHELSKSLRGDLEYRRQHPYPPDWLLPATERQQAYLSFLGSPCTMADMTKGRASELIDALVEQFPDKVTAWNNQPATAAQKERLSFLGGQYPADITLGQARQLLDDTITPENEVLWSKYKGTDSEHRGVSVTLRFDRDGKSTVDAGGPKPKGESILAKLKSYFFG